MNKRQQQQRFIEEHQTMVWRYARLLGADASLADDLTQETFVYVLKRPFEDRHPRATRSYLRTVTRHLYIDRLRRERKLVDMSHIAEADLVWSEHYPDDQGQERLEALRICLGSLDPNAQALISARFEKKQPYAEICAQTGLGESAAKMVVSRAIKALGECVRGRLSQ